MQTSIQERDTVSLFSEVDKMLKGHTPHDSFLNLVVVETAKFTLRVWDLIVISFVILVTVLFLKLIKRAITRNKKMEAGKQYSLYNLTKYVVSIFSFMWILQYIGVKITILLGGSAALLVGVGLGLQNLFSDFVSGIILLIDSSIKVGDVIDVNGLICQVKRINLRTTQVITRDDKFILLPNSQLTKNNIINWTHNLTTSRFDVTVGAGYDSDALLVERLLLEVIDEQEEILKEPKPFVRLADFSDSNLIFTVYFWSQNIFRAENIKSNVRFGIYRKFNQYNIDIALPQRVVHFYDRERGKDLKRYTKDDLLE